MLYLPAKYVLKTVSSVFLSAPPLSHQPFPLKHCLNIFCLKKKSKENLHKEYFFPLRLVSVLFLKALQLTNMSFKFLKVSSYSFCFRFTDLVGPIGSSYVLQ